MKRILFVTNLCLWLLASCGTTEDQKQEPMRVKTATAQKMKPEGAKEYPFISQPVRSSELSFRVSGPLEEFEVYAGNRYAAGEVIARIDGRDFELALQKAEVVYRQAQVDLQRAKALLESGSLSASAYDETDIACQQARIAYENAQNALEDTRLTAPFSGYAGEVFIERYQDVRAAQPVMSLVDISRLKIEVYLPQETALRMQKGQQLALHFDAEPNRCYMSEVADVARSTSSNNLSYLLTALLPNEKGILPAGMSGKAIITPEKSMTTSVVVPYAALCHRPTTGDYVWMVDENGVVKMRRVEAGELLEDGTVEITKGLEAGERVAVSGMKFMSEGLTVKSE